MEWYKMEAQVPQNYTLVQYLSKFLQLLSTSSGFILFLTENGAEIKVSEATHFRYRWCSS